MKFLGLTRFNVVTQHTLGAFRATKGKTLEEAKSAIYTDENLTQRMTLLKNFCISTYEKLSENPDSHGVIIVNDDLPSRYRHELNDACAAVPRLHIVDLPDDGGYAKWIKPALLDLIGDDDIYSYRYDDDDALPTDYLKKVEEIIWGREREEIVISFNDGYSLTKFSDDDFGFGVRHYPANAFGLGRYSKKGAFKNIFELGSHGNIREAVHNDRDTIGWLATIHEGNDSRVGKAKSSGVTKVEVLQKLAARFPHITEPALDQLSLRRAPDM